MKRFKIVSKNKPAGDQPQAIQKLVGGLKKGMNHQTLLGVTGSGKTFTIANVIQEIQKPTLVIAHNKTLAAQLCNEFRELFPHNSVHYFVSYYDYYQPEAYIPTSDTYIGKEAMINEEIDKLRHAATTALLTRHDVIVVASVSCIYGLGAPEIYAKNIFHFKVGDHLDRKTLSRKLVELQFNRTTSDLKRGTFRLRGNSWEIMPPDREIIYRFDIENEILVKIYEVDPVRGFSIEHKKQGSLEGETSNGVDPVKGFDLEYTPYIPEIFVAPAKHFITLAPEREKAIKLIKEELKNQLRKFEREKKFLEAERLERRTKFDLAMIREVGYCHGIENYSRHLSGREEGAPPDTLLNYFPNPPAGGFLTVIDESHVTVPQIGGMYAGDASRKKTLIEYGFRLPSAADNRPLRFEEFNKRVGQIIFTTATPSDYERKVSDQIVEQIIRPTGLVDPKLTIKPVVGQINDLIGRIKERVNRPDGKKERVLVTTLTKKMAEDLSEYLANLDNSKLITNNKQLGQKNKKSSVMSYKLSVAYLHSDVKTLDRIKILTRLRKGEIDVLVGVNLLREGLDLPEVSLVAILDADKEGFLRSETSLIQTIGRAARNKNGEVLIYADNITGSVARAVRETERRRKIQLAYNKEHDITPKTIFKEIKDILPTEKILNLELKVVPKSNEALKALIKQKELEMREAADALDFELATILRDEIKVLFKKINPPHK